MKEELERALREAGVSRAQLGGDGVAFTIEDDEITLYLGDADEAVCSSVEKAVEHIQAHAEDAGADPDVTGAIVELAEWLQALVADEGSVYDAATALMDQIVTEAEHLELIHHRKLTVLAAAGHDMIIEPVGTEVAFFEDGNGLFWSLYVSEGDTIAHRELSLND